MVLPRVDVLAPGFVWIRTLDAGPVLTTRAALGDGETLSLGASSCWPNVPQVWQAFFLEPE